MHIFYISGQLASLLGVPFNTFSTSTCLTGADLEHACLNTRVESVSLVGMVLH